MSDDKNEAFIEVAKAPGIDDDSWLHRDGEEYEKFRAGYRYASGQTHAIGALSKLTPEEAFHLWSAIERGIEKEGADE